MPISADVCKVGEWPVASVNRQDDGTFWVDVDLIGTGRGANFLDLADAQYWAESMLRKYITDLAKVLGPQPDHPMPREISLLDASEFRGALKDLLPDETAEQIRDEFWSGRNN